jgi:replicative DNA helicase
MLEYTPIEAERSMLSAMIQNIEAAWQALDIVSYEDYLEPRHSRIGEAISRLAQNNSPVGPIAVIEALAQMQELRKVGGEAYIHQLYGEAPTWVNVEFYAEIVRKEAIRRKLAAAAASVAQIANDPTLPADAAAEMARAAIDNALSVTEAVKDEDLRAANQSAVDMIGTVSPGYPTPWHDLSRVIGGFMQGRLYVIGARPAVGKSALALQCASQLEQFGHVGFFSLEMGALEVRHRKLVQEADIAAHLVNNGKALPPPFDDRAQMWVDSSPARMYIDDRGALTIADIRSQVRTWSRKHKLTGIVVDYLQLISGDPRESKVQQVTEISRQLKLMAKEYQVPVIALSQLNRQSESRADKRPTMADMRESGSIEQDADVIMLLHPVNSGFTPGTHDEILMHVAKNRQGPTSEIHLEWQGDFVRAV